MTSFAPPHPIANLRPPATLPDGTVTLTLVALGKAAVPVKRPLTVACFFDDNALAPASAKFHIRELKQGRWHRHARTLPHTDQIVTECGRKIPGQRLMTAVYGIAPGHHPDPSEVERDRLCCRCF